MIVLENVSKKFGTTTIIDKANLNFETGISYALCGKSGSGKSTLLNLVGLIEKPNNGNILINNVKNPRLEFSSGRKLLRYDIGYLLQDFGLVNDLTVYENLKLVTKYNKKSKTEIKNALEKVGLIDKLDSHVLSLSGGQQQRVAICALLLKAPTIILCDEPTANLDDENKHEVLKLLWELLTKDSILIIATHDLEVSNLCDVKINVPQMTKSI